MHLPTPTLINPDLQRIGRIVCGELEDLEEVVLLGDEDRGNVCGERGLRELD